MRFLLRLKRCSGALYTMYNWEHVWYLRYNYVCFFVVGGGVVVVVVVVFVVVVVCCNCLSITQYLSLNFAIPFQC